MLIAYMSIDETADGCARLLLVIVEIRNGMEVLSGPPNFISLET